MKNPFARLFHGRLSKVRLLLVAGIAGLTLLSAGYVGNNLFEISKSIDIYTSIYRELNTYYVDEVDPNELMRSGVDAMLKSLDPYTVYISEAELEGHRFQMTGRYGGIGAVIRKVDGRVTVVEPYEGFAAEKAGLMAGDVILSIDGKSTEGKNTDDISDILRGSPGTEVELEIERPFSDPKNRSIKLERMDIDIENVPYYGLISEGVAYIRLGQFTENAGRHVAEALSELKQENGELKGVVFDLRGNPGGLLREAVNVSNVFVPRGELIVSTRGKVKDWDRNFYTTNQPIDTLVPLVVLIDRSSASASEIIAGVVQDLDRGVVIGERSFGKGLVQSTRDLSYKTKLKITTAKYYTPSGRCIQAIDYANRNDDGSVGKIPDSLKTAFQTRAGRTVYDGGGIEPDLELDLPTYAQITVALLRNNHIFHYATRYRHERDSIDAPMDYRFEDDEFEEFIAWLVDKEYDYGTSSEDLLDELVETAEYEHYLEAIGADIEALREKLHADKEKDLEKFRDEIREEIEQEIVTRYHYQTGSIENSFYKDMMVRRAIELFDEEQTYRSLLRPQAGNE